MIKLNVIHNGYGFGAYYRHYGGRTAAFSRSRAEFERRLERFLRLCRRFGIKVQVVRCPSFFCGLAAELGDEFAAQLLHQARECQGPWANWDAWAGNAAQEREARFAIAGGWPTVREGDADA